MLLRRLSCYVILLTDGVIKLRLRTRREFNVTIDDTYHDATRATGFDLRPVIRHDMRKMDALIERLSAGVRENSCATANSFIFTAAM
jgi:hypothetical protein